MGSNREWQPSYGLRGDSHRPALPSLLARKGTWPPTPRSPSTVDGGRRALAAGAPAAAVGIRRRRAPTASSRAVGPLRRAPLP
ncbi:Os03g0196100 [Oryza sativa Japonica Group]|uniref:Os03g0196100 protein n=2 Tax=Oryza TaxID=4527 RepID=Q0DUB2_ORYSJ|nr:hypothetical protein DAI22_03g074000 [Oryza sativa Japonica Group]BAF11176.1 Os03g0196100 [Oryza sativa Japonica Group]|eukprot:NP_001049262.1 Os03g0196100 [Oryza sativa Japonica Group]